MTHGPKPNKDVIEDLVQKTAAPVELVKNLYEDEVTKLKAGATVETYIGVLASQRVKRKLRDFVKLHAAKFRQRGSAHS